MSRGRLVFLIFFAIVAVIVVLTFLFRCKTDNSLPMPLDITTEDDKIMEGLWYEGNGDLNNSVKIFKDLYVQTKSDAYLLETIRLSLLTGTRLKESEIQLEKLYAKNPNDTKVLRLLLTLHLVQKNFDKAKQEADKLIEVSRDKLDISVASDALIYANEPNRALEVLNNLYDTEHDEEIALRMATILSDMYKENNQAISLLHGHYALYGGSQELQNKLFDIYILNDDTDRAYEFAREIYKDSMDYSYIQRVAQKLYDKKQCVKADSVIKEISSQDALGNPRIKEIKAKIESCIKSNKRN